MFDKTKQNNDIFGFLALNLFKIDTFSLRIITTIDIICSHF